jgi:hypothetical protein
LPPDLTARSAGRGAAVPVTPDRDGARRGGAFLSAGPGVPVAAFLPGSGPADRDGDDPKGNAAAPSRKLATALAVRGVTSLRVGAADATALRAARPDATAVDVPGGNHLFRPAPADAVAAFAARARAA